MKVKSESEVAQSCPTLSDPMDCSLPGSSIHGIFQASVNFPCHFLNFFLCLLVSWHKEPQRKNVGILPREEERTKEVVKSLM